MSDYNYHQRLLQNSNQDVSNNAQGLPEVPKEVGNSNILDFAPKEKGVASRIPTFTCNFENLRSDYETQDLSQGISNSHYLHQLMTQDQDLHAFLQEKLGEKNLLFGLIQGRVNSEGLCKLTQEYYGEHPEKLQERHITQRDFEEATNEFTKENADNHKNITFEKMAISTAIGLCLLGAGLPLITAGIGGKLSSLVVHMFMSDGDQVSTGGIHYLTTHNNFKAH